MRVLTPPMSSVLIDPLQFGTVQCNLKRDLFPSSALPIPVACTGQNVEVSLILQPLDALSRPTSQAHIYHSFAPWRTSHDTAFIQSRLDCPDQSLPALSGRTRRCNPTPRAGPASRPAAATTAANCGHQRYP